MARLYRLQLEDCFYHITSRGNDRKKIFLKGSDIFDKEAHGINKWGDRKDIQDEGAGGE